MRILVAVTLSFLAFNAHAQSNTLRFAAGAGIEGRIRQDINPDMPSPKFRPPLFMQVHLNRWTAQLEFTPFDEQTSNLGALTIKTETYTLGAWGHYAFREPFHWSPFLSAGFGVIFDKVESTYFNESAEITGQRYFSGFGGGITHELIPNLEVEGELRAALIEDRKDVSFSGIVRVGVIL